MLKTRRPLKIALGVGLALAVVGTGAVALANHPGFRAAFFKKMVSMKIDGALDAAKASPAQRAAIDAARDRVFAAVETAHEQHPFDMQEKLSMFEADRLDQQEIAKLRAEHMATAQRIGDVVIGAVKEAHDALTHEQRQAVVAYVKENLPAHHMGGHGGPGMFKQMMQKHVDEAMTAANVTPAQRTAIQAAIDHAHAVMEENHVDHKQLVEQATELFLADRWDDARVAALRAQHQARMVAVGDAIQQAVSDVHDALTPAQRKAVVGFVKQQREEMHDRWMQHHGAHQPAAE